MNLNHGETQHGSELPRKLEYALSDTDIKQQVKNCRLIEYPELKNYDSITELLPNHKDAVVILVQIKNRHSGHWICLTRFKNVIYLFDPLAYRPDKNLLWTPKYLRRQLGQNIPYLSYLLNDALSKKFKVYFNEFKYQQEKQGVNTCGRHVVNYLRWFYMTISPTPMKYETYMKGLVKKYDLGPDIIVAQHTSP
jgi:AraC-like DNA-binding protein